MGCASERVLPQYSKIGLRAINILILQETRRCNRKTVFGCGPQKQLGKYRQSARTAQLDWNGSEQDKRLVYSLPKMQAGVILL